MCLDDQVFSKRPRCALRPRKRVRRNSGKTVRNSRLSQSPLRFAQDREQRLAYTVRGKSGHTQLARPAKSFLQRWLGSFCWSLCVAAIQTPRSFEKRNETELPQGLKHLNCAAICS